MCTELTNHTGRPLSSRQKARALRQFATQSVAIHISWWWRNPNGSALSFVYRLSATLPLRGLWKDCPSFAQIGLVGDLTAQAGTDCTKHALQNRWVSRHPAPQLVKGGS